MRCRASHGTGVLPKPSPAWPAPHKSLELQVVADGAAWLRSTRDDGSGNISASVGQPDQRKINCRHRQGMPAQQALRCRSFAVQQQIAISSIIQINGALNPRFVFGGLILIPNFFVCSKRPFDPQRLFVGIKIGPAQGQQFIPPCAAAARQRDNRVDAG